MNVQATLVPEGGGIFDVQVNDDLVYSKHNTGTFPDDQALAAEILNRYSE